MICLRCKEDKVAEFVGQRVCKQCSKARPPRVGKAVRYYKPKAHKVKKKHGNDNAQL